MPHRFRVTLQPVDDTDTSLDAPPLTFTVTNHDDILAFADRIADKQVLPDDSAAPFAVGLKLFTEVLLQNRKNPLFSELQPHIAAFMRRLKSLPDGDAE